MKVGKKGEERGVIDPKSPVGISCLRVVMQNQLRSMWKFFFQVVREEMTESIQPWSFLRRLWLKPFEAGYMAGGRRIRGR